MNDATASARTATASSTGSRTLQRFEGKREKILIAATHLVNERGIKGMTLRDVANVVDPNTTNIGYYFPRKEMLAAAVFEHTLARLEKMVREASRGSTPQERVALFVSANVTLREQVLRGTSLPLAKLSEMRALDDIYRKPLDKHFQAIFRQVRAFFGQAEGEMHKALLTARTHMLLEVIFWLPLWISQYPLNDFPKVKARLLKLLATGIGHADAEWSPALIDLAASEGISDDDGPENFLRAATRLINDAGYRGASVVRIAHELNVTKGSFYHHLDTKDALVLECFRRSYRRVSHVLSLAEAAQPDGWRRLTTAIATLLNVQFYREWPLLRTSAFQALPADLRADAVARSDRAALSFAGTLIEGMEDGSIRVADPMIASQLIIATVNTAYDLRKWASSLPPDAAIALYASSLVDGLFNNRVLAHINITGATPGTERPR